MNKILSFVFISFISVLFPLSALAQVSFTEIMYDVPGTDTGREWVEVQNTGGDSVDLSSYKFFEANTNHRIEAQGPISVPTQSFAVIADDATKFKADNPSYTGLLFTSSFLLSNTGESLALKTGDGTAVDTILYDVTLGANGNGKTLQKHNGTWVEGDATPGGDYVGNTATSSNSSSSNNTSTTTAASANSTSTNAESVSQITYANSSQATVYTGDDAADLEISGGRDRLASVGSPINFEGKVRSIKTSNVGDVRFRWSFGDGSALSGPFVSHTYSFPGEYEVVLNGTYQLHDAVARIRVRVVDSNVHIANVDAKSIEIANDSKYEINIGGHFLRSGKSQYVIPDDTIILSGKSVKVPTAISKIVLTGTVELKNPSGEVVARKNIIPSFPRPVDVVDIGMSADELRVKISDALLRYQLPQVTSLQVAVTPKISPTISTSTQSTVPKTTLTSNQVAGAGFVVNRGDEGIVSRFMKWIFD